MLIIKDPKLGDSYDGSTSRVRHGFFGRQNGVSEGLYDSLNCGVGSDDDPGVVAENRKRVAGYFDAAPENLITVWQVHSPDCIYIDKPVAAGIDRPKADALVTDRAGLVLGVLTADCGPILFVGEKADGSPVIGASHAGWGGALNGVLESTVKKMIEMEATPESICAAVGPCIGPKSYEVSIGFEKPFLAREPQDEHFFREARKEGHLMFDLPGYIASRLAGAGVKQVTITGHDTFAEADSFFSYRRTTHAKEPDYGRQISAISIIR